ncbi:MAG: VOC family protein [Patescibacteria group bacterium]
MEKILGIGGLLFKSKNPEATNEWYRTNLGLNINDYGATLEWRDVDNPDLKRMTQWSAFEEKTKYFEPSQSEYMINYIVKDLELMVEQLKKNGVEFLDEIAVYEYGKFVHILDSDGRKIELWEPTDQEEMTK